MKALELFPPTRAAALERIAAVRPAEYARSRNALEGAVTRLSPYITHGIVSLPEVLAGVLGQGAARHRLGVQHKFVFELGWREYFQHVWEHRGDAILRSLHAGPLPEAAYAPTLPADIRRARTGVPVVDEAVRTLYATGWLHNHARMWLASYVVHLRKVHWRAGADWMFGHLLDGDLASNHLSWQWVAGTGSTKPYLFNADNVARYAPAAWHSPGSVIDTSYEALDRIAHGASPLPARGRPADGEAGAEPALEPACRAWPPAAATAPQPGPVAGRDVWLVHPWALGEPPADLPADCVRVGWWPAEFLAAWPWSEARRCFVATRMAELAPLQWHGQREALGRALAGARSVQTLANGHLRGALPAGVRLRASPSLFPPVDRPCPSFSAWWTRVTRGLQQITDLPGLHGLVPPPPSPLQSELDLS
jgi:deoxyribodipyrimidine photo-lyase